MRTNCKNGTIENLRAAGLQAILAYDGTARGLMMEREEGDSYAALFMGETDMILVRIFDRYSDDLEVYLDRAENLKEIF